MESPIPYDESPLDGDDVVYPCKGCGDILEEGKAFELAGNRWHIDCFRCHTCGTLLDSDANLLLLGDGSLICNNCTYSCSACGNKIEDLAILTGDQAFCAGCFRCRSCKRKIDNLRYARTSQGIFCMSCHESLMARRRKKAKTKLSTNGASNAPAPGAADKALPSLPPSAAHGAASSTTTAPVQDSPSESLAGTPRAMSPVQHSSGNMKVPSSQRRDRDPSPLSEDDHSRDGTTLPSSTYQTSRSAESEDGDAESGFLPMAFDPNPAPRLPQVSRKGVPQSSDYRPAQREKDYFEGKSERGSRSASAEREALHNLHFPTAGAPKLSPHIAFQDKNRQQKRTASGSNTPGTYTPVVPSPVASTHAERDRIKAQPSSNISTSTGNFNLQEVPKNRKGSSRSGAGMSPVNRQGGADLEVSPISADSDINPFEDPKLKETVPSILTPIPPRHADRPLRGDSLAATKATSNRSSADPGTPSAREQKSTPFHERGESVSSVHTSNFVDARENGIPDTPVAAAFASDGPPPRASSRPTVPFASDRKDSAAPRDAPAAEALRQSRTASAQLSDGSSGQTSPALRPSGLPRLTSDGTFSMETEMMRIWKGDREDAETVSVLRRASNAVKHGRSFSDRGSLSKIAATNGAADPNVVSPSAVSSTLTSPVTGQDTVESLRVQLQRARRRITDLETEKSGLQEQVHNSTVIAEVNDELKQKRTTMAFLDSQREIVVRELETMTRHLEKVKKQKQPLDLPALKSDILEDFADELRKLKEHVGAQVEDLMHKRNELTSEITDLIAMKDKGFQEYDSLSTKNAQLVEMNNQLLHNIQEGFKANRVDAKSNGLGIYHPGARVETSSDMRNLNFSSDASMANLLHDTDGDGATVLPAPQVVNIRKGQVKKFNWRKGGASVAKGVTKGLKGAFVNTDKPGVDVSQIGLPYGMTQQALPGSEQSSMYTSAKSTVSAERPGQGFAIFGQKAARVPVGGLRDPGMVTAAEPSTLFGSELEARCDFEKRIIPNIVMRCIAEVETRGMHVEGIYRKSGGSGQVKSVQAGFEKDSNHDINDPDLEIHAVTSALKQYFRKLPTPLITYDVYDSLLDAGSVTDKDRQAIALRQALAELPPHHRGCLEYLVRHLARVMHLERDNLMTPLNLAVVFAPTIMRPLSIEREMSDGLAQRAAVQALLELHETVFEDE